MNVSDVDKTAFLCEFYRFIHDKNGVRVSKGEFQSRVSIIKVEYIFPMVISSEFRMKHYTLVRLNSGMASVTDFLKFPIFRKIDVFL